MNALPVVLEGHVQTAMCVTTSQLAFVPHELMQGFTHRFLTHVLSRGQSELSEHSGRQPKYGSPWYSGKQVQTPLSQFAFGPHGDGLQGSVAWGSENKVIILVILCSQV